MDGSLFSMHLFITIAMKPGMFVNVFLDPIEQSILEGRATLVNFKADFELVELWEVVFDDSPNHIYERYLKK